MFNRFAASKMEIKEGPMPVFAPDKEVLGGIDVIEIAQGRVRVAGWSFGQSVTATIGGAKMHAPCNLIREDVASAHGVDPDVGFDMTAPLGQISRGELRRLEFQVSGFKGDVAPVNAHVLLRHGRKEQLRLVLLFGQLALAAIPPTIGWYATKDAKYRARVKRIFNLTHNAVMSEVDPALFDTVTPDLARSAPEITIVMPIYNAFELLDEALSRVLSHTDLPFRLVLIEDGSTDERVRPALHEFVTRHDAEHPDQTGRITLLENPENLGFIKSVNRGFDQAVAWGNPVVLLNSDAFVPAHWASRLLHPLVKDNTVASATPMSNDAEIYTVPLICQRNDLAAGMADQIDRTAMKLNPQAGMATAPTGVGFCMAISVAFLKKLGALDTTFGRGYGEEVDWCQKVRAMGGRHVGVPNLFVEHRGGQSFGSAEKLQLVARNNAVISKRYPDYDAEVQTFIRTDPMHSARLALAMAWVAQMQDQVSIYFAHSLGGGAEDYLKRHIADTHTARGNSAIIIRAGGPVRWQVELITPDGMVAGGCAQIDLVDALLAPVETRRIVYSCAVGDPEPLEVPQALLRLGRNGADPIDILFHDFYPLSPSYTLLDSDGIFRGAPRVESHTDKAHQLRRRGVADVDLATWQSEWGEVIKVAQTLVTFSQDSAAHVSAVYPWATDKIVVRPHSLLTQVPKLPAPAPQAPRVVAVLGNIGKQKGAALLAGLARSLEAQGARLVLIGTIDPAYALPSSVPIHGAYAIADLPQIVTRYGITDWLVPSIWPETFSYTTHEALATGLPVHAFDIGAQGDAVATRDNGRPVKFGDGANLDQTLADHFNDTLHRPKETSST